MSQQDYQFYILPAFHADRYNSPLFGSVLLLYLEDGENNECGYVSAGVIVHMASVAVHILSSTPSFHILWRKCDTRKWPWAFEKLLKEEDSSDRPLHAKLKCSCTLFLDVRQDRLVQDLYHLLLKFVSVLTHFLALEQ